MAFKCPNCNRLIPNRNKRACEYCNEFLPQELLFNDDQKEALGRIKAKDRLRQIEWEIRNFEPADPELVDPSFRLESLQEERESLKRKLNDNEWSTDRPSYGPTTFNGDDEFFGNWSPDAAQRFISEEGNSNKTDHTPEKDQSYAKNIDSKVRELPSNTKNRKKPWWQFW